MCSNQNHTKVNTTLRTNAVAELPPLQDFIVHLDCGLANLPPLQLCGQLFRGIDVRVDEVSVCVCVFVCARIHSLYRRGCEPHSLSAL